MAPLCPPSHVLETCLYVSDVHASSQFYQRAFNIEPFSENERSAGFALGDTTLLLFGLGKTTTDINTPNGVIPCHGPSPSILSQFRSNDEGSPRLRQHVCLAVRDPEEVTQWKTHLKTQGVPITSQMNWERGGKSVYFEDPDGHVLEIGSRGLWPHY
ncbi:hypothetical protein EYZ11_004301 [Aspergillus tanneri]|uniref:VOC domain-containing protein n=1 Tax=Aspergillus tanneri TaxID=1220188 RepID=A0A4S3JL80_9EURO|nr:hypothetical protein EYZ11_004301 [Aspergillus tanneri]